MPYERNQEPPLYRKDSNRDGDWLEERQQPWAERRAKKVILKLFYSQKSKYQATWLRQNLPDGYVNNAFSTASEGRFEPASLGP
jgi:hypothetical protein